MLLKATKLGCVAGSHRIYEKWRKNNNLMLDRFCTKEECVRAIKKFKIENSADYTVDRIDVRMYVILCRNELSMF